jgi:clan AA aspartic protease (TIGR02281 family)
MRIKKFTIFKYLIFIGLIVALCCYSFYKISPKGYQTAKEELIGKIFGDVIKKQNNVTNDSLVANHEPMLIENKETITINDTTSSTINVPIDIVDNIIYLKAKVNGVDMRFILDTGCATILLTSAEYYYMKHLGLISENKLQNDVECTYADGSKETCPTMKLDLIEIGDLKIKNIDAIIQENCKADLLLGQEVLKELGEISIDYNKKLLKIKRK